MTSPEVIFTICRRTTASPCHILKSLIQTIHGITSTLPIVGRAYLALIRIATVFSIGWYKLETSRKTRVPVNTKKILVTPGIFHGIPLKSVALLVFIACRQSPSKITIQTPKTVENRKVNMLYPKNIHKNTFNLNSAEN